MNHAPWTDIGRLQQELNDVKRRIDQKSEEYEIHALDSKLDRLEHSLREIGSRVDGLFNRLQTLEEKELNREPATC